jgi:serine/threonine protein phosphatase 1
MKDENLSNEYIHVYDLAKTLGRCFVVADIHGNYNEFMVCLNQLNFDFSKDTIFSLGDIVDRGSDNVKSMSLIHEPWFKLIKGNHEAMIQESFFENAWGNGTAWASQIYHTEGHPDKLAFQKFKDALESVPYIFDIRLKDQRWLGVHAELPHMCMNKNDCSYEALMEDADVRYFTSIWPRESNVLWGRSHYQYNDVYCEADWIFHGHTIFSKPLVRGNRLYMDTGFFEGYQLYEARKIPGRADLTFVELGEQEIVHRIEVEFCDSPYVTKHEYYNLEMQG